MNINWEKVDMKKVGEKLYSIRKSKNLSQNEFIKDCNIQYRQYSKYENGKQKPKTNIENFFKLLSKHDINVEWLLYNKNVSQITTDTASLYLEVKTKNARFKISFDNKTKEYLDKVLELYRVSV
jgi:transcriptional regulator with XRE-family HTH domain